MRSLLSELTIVFQLKTESDAKPEIVAAATINTRTVTKTNAFCRELKLEKSPKLFVGVKHPPKAIPHFNQSGLPVFEIRPGQTIEATVIANRNGHDTRINFGKEEAAVNLPFGIYVDNTGLNGVLIPPGQTERTFQLTAEDWVEPCSRVIFLVAEEAGKPASQCRRATSFCRLTTDKVASAKPSFLIVEPLSSTVPGIVFLQDAGTFPYRMRIGLRDNRFTLSRPWRSPVPRTRWDWEAHSRVRTRKNLC